MQYSSLVRDMEHGIRLDARVLDVYSSESKESKPRSLLVASGSWGLRVPANISNFHSLLARQRHAPWGNSRNINRWYAACTKLFENEFSNENASD